LAKSKSAHLVNRSFKILVINWQDITNPLGGGAEVHFHEIFKRLAQRGHKVTLLCCRYPGAAEEEVIDGIKIIRRGSRGLFNFYVPVALRRLIKREKPDIVFDDINKIPFFTPLFVREPLVAIVHHFFGKSIFLEAPFIPASYVYVAEKLVPRIYRHTDFAVVSESSKQELVGSGIRSSITLLPNAVDKKMYFSDKSLKSGTPLIGYLGRLKKYKCVDHVLLAMKHVLQQIPQAELLIIGDGDDRRRLERLVQMQGMEKAITFTGQVSHDKKVALLNKVWLTINPSPKEGWGLTVIEANACGCPVVAADSPGLRDSIMHDRTGLLYPFGDTEVLAENIISLVNYKERRDFFSTQAILWAQKFDWEKSADKAVEIIEKKLTD
jgi:glycosyltransferase involved in cell wall biosynthesis